MKKFISIILIAIAFASVSVAGSNDFPKNSVSVQNLDLTFLNYLEDRAASHSSECEECSSTDHACSQCHFGHCGFFACQSNFIPLIVGSKYSLMSQTQRLKSFLSNPFRPPIA